MKKNNKKKEKMGNIDYVVFFTVIILLAISEFLYLTLTLLFILNVIFP